jgi:hypothetical protein
MLYAGVEFDRSGFTVTVLSDSFARLAEQRFHRLPPLSVLTWIARFKSKSTELVRWYFDDADWVQAEFPTHLFTFADHCNSVYLVKHRLLCNLNQFLLEWNASVLMSAIQIKKSFLLASTSRLMGHDQLKRMVTDSQPF